MFIEWQKLYESDLNSALGAGRDDFSNSKEDGAARTQRLVTSHMAGFLGLGP